MHQDFPVDLEMKSGTCTCFLAIFMKNHQSITVTLVIVSLLKKENN